MTMRPTFPLVRAASSRIEILDLVQKIISLAGHESDLQPIIVSETKAEFEIDAKYLSEEKIYDAFGWQAEIGIDAGLIQTIEWYRGYLGAAETV